MKERPIIMNAESVRAIIGGRKTQTRRVIKPQPPKGGRVSWLSKDTETKMALDWAWWDALDRIGKCVNCPYGQPGDLLWLRETWATTGNFDNYKPSELPLSHFSAESHLVYRATAKNSEPYYKWRPSIYMPRWASRITLRVTDVRVERVQEISQEDARAEGCEPWHPKSNIPFRPEGSYRNAFHKLWDEINAERGYSWSSNPWVWVVDFQVLT